MKKKQLLLRLCMFCFFCMFLGISYKVPANAQKPIKKSKVTIPCQDETESVKNYKKINFKISSDSYVLLSFNFKTVSKEECKKGSIRVVLKDKKGKVLKDDKSSIKNISKGYNALIYTDEILEPSKYSWTIYNDSDQKIKVSYAIRKYSDISTRATIEKKVSQLSGSTVKIGKLNNLPIVKSVKLSSKKVLKDYGIMPDGSIYVLTNKPGKATVTVTLKNGRKYTCTITVENSPPYFKAKLNPYKTNDPYFTVSVTNTGVSNLVIIRKGTVKHEKDKSLNRKLKSMSNVTIKPGKTKIVRFSIKKPTVYKEGTTFFLNAKVKYQGLTFKWTVYDVGSRVSYGKWWDISDR